MFASSISFTGYKPYSAPDYNNDAHVRDVIRERIDRQTDNVKQTYWFNKISKSEAEYMMKTVNKSIQRDFGIVKEEDRPDLKVDFDILADTKPKIKNLNERKRGKLYSGGHFAQDENIHNVETLKKAGIRTVLSLVGDERYRKKCEEEGLNYIQLNQIGKGNLEILSYLNLKPEFAECRQVLADLIENPDLWVDKNSTNAVKDLKELVKIMKGENENFPYPIYYGCGHGDVATDIWTKVYKALKNEDTTLPLRSETLQELEKIIAGALDAHGLKEFAAA